MSDLLEAFEKAVLDAMKSPLVISLISERRLRAHGLRLSRETSQSFRATFRWVDDARVEFDLDEIGSEFTQLAPTEQQAIVDRLSVPPSDDEIQAAMEQVLTAAKGAMPQMFDEVSDELTNDLESCSGDLLRHNASERADFASTIAQLWGPVLDKFEVFLSLCRESGQARSEEGANLEDPGRLLLLHTLLRLHARCCQIGMEVLCLLRAGFADGAHARWRSAHEVSVVMCLLRKGGPELVERYLRHDAVQSLKAAREWVRIDGGLDATGIPPEEYQRLNDRVDGLKARYGKPFARDYGWAAAHLGQSNVTFAEIEQYLGLQAARPNYKMASHNVHANSKGITFKLGTPPDADAVMLAGGSVYGMADPVQCTINTILHATVELHSSTGDLGHSVLSVALSSLAERAHEFTSATESYVLGLESFTEDELRAMEE